MRSVTTDLAYNPCLICRAGPLRETRNNDFGCHRPARVSPLPSRGPSPSRCRGSIDRARRPDRHPSSVHPGAHHGPNLRRAFTGAALGWKLGAAGQLLYVAVGAFGAPVFTEASGGVEVIRGATGGYLIGFIFAAGLVGWLAEHRQDRAFLTMVAAFLMGSGVIYLFGVVGLMIATGWGLGEAVAKGVTPFIVGGSGQGGDRRGDPARFLASARGELGAGPQAVSRSSPR